VTFGTSVLTTNPVLEDILKTFPATLELATLGILIGAGAGRAAGCVGGSAARRRGGPGGAGHGPDRVFGADLLAGLMALVLFYAKLDWVAGPGRIDVTHTNTR
jgi:peptide/nickel transport system permease protein